MRFGSVCPYSLGSWSAGEEDSNIMVDSSGPCGAMGGGCRSSLHVNSCSQISGREGLWGRFVGPRLVVGVLFMVEVTDLGRGEMLKFSPRREIAGNNTAKSRTRIRVLGPPEQQSEHARNTSRRGRSLRQKRRVLPDHVMSWNLVGENESPVGHCSSWRRGFGGPVARVDYGQGQDDTSEDAIHRRMYRCREATHSKIPGGGEETGSGWGGVV